MKALFKKPVVQRLIGAIGAGIATFVSSHDWRVAVTTAVTFLVYGTAHLTVAGRSES